MGKQSTGNVVFGGTFITAIIELGGPSILRWLGWARAAQWLESLAAVSIEGVTINWTGVLFWVAIVAAMGVLATNWNWGVGKFYERKWERQRTWKTPVPYAVHYIANHSMTVVAATNREAILSARAAFEEAARRGKIRVAGIRRNEHNISEIPRGIWGAAKLATDQWTARGDAKSALTLFWEDAPLYTNLLIDRKEMEKVWVERPSETGWMGV
jgi:hypothetical protein